MRIVLSFLTMTLLLSSISLAHSPDKMREKAKEKREAQREQCEKFLDRPAHELDSSSPIIQAMLKRCEPYQMKEEEGEESQHDHHDH